MNASIAGPAVMSAAVITQPQTLQLQSVPVPMPGPGQVRVRLEGCGVCASNVPPWEGREWFKYPMAPGHLGHEGWGTIDFVGEEVRGLRLGQRVTFLSDNAYAEYDVTDAEKIVPLPESLNGRVFPGEPLGCAMNIFERSGIGPGQTVAIIGIGFLGALLTQLAVGVEARVIAVSRRDYSLDVARSMGAMEVLPLAEPWRVVQRVQRLTEGELCDVVIEAVGKQAPLDLAAELTGVRGRLVVAGFHQDGSRQVNMQMWNWRGLDVINAHERDVRKYITGIQRAVDAVVAGRLSPWPLLTHEYTLGHLGQALDESRQRPDGFLKALVRMTGPTARVLGES